MENTSKRLFKLHHHPQNHHYNHDHHHLDTCDGAPDRVSQKTLLAPLILSTCTFDLKNNHDDNSDGDDDDIDDDDDSYDDEDAEGNDGDSNLLPALL